MVARVDDLMALRNRLEVNLATGDDTRRRPVDALQHGALEPATNRERAT